MHSTRKTVAKNQDGPIYYRPYSSAGFAADDRFKPPLTASRFVLDEHKEVTSDHPPGLRRLMRKKIIAVIAISVWLIMFAMVAIFDDRNPSETTTAQQADSTSQTEKSAESTNKATSTPDKAQDECGYTDALRKCTVMEAADIHTTGVGAKTNNAFNDGRDTCNSMFTNTYASNEVRLISDVDSDWSNRKSETVDGKSLEYYLGVLGW